MPQKPEGIASALEQNGYSWLRFSVRRGETISDDGVIQSNTKGRSPWPIRRDLYTYRWRVTIATDTGELTLTADRIAALAEHCGCSGEDLADLEIATFEALANALRHGNLSDTAKNIRVRCYAAPEHSIVIIVKDEGPGFDPTNVPDPRDGARVGLSHGRGLLLMRELVDHVEYRKAGAEVLLYKYWGG